jgi:polyisoprenoid-binding protein YceI
MSTANESSPGAAGGGAAGLRAAARPSTWVLDASRSSAAFRHKTMWGLATVRGTLAELTGTAEILADGSARGRLEIAAASLNTKNAKRDEHLRSADFFNAAQHRHIVAELRRAVLREGETVGIEGELTVAGSTRPLNFAARVTEASEGAVTLLAELKIGRSDFNMTWNRMGMITCPATVVIVARFTRMTDQA